MPTSKKSMRTFPVQASSVLHPPDILSLSKSLVPVSTSSTAAASSSSSTPAKHRHVAPRATALQTITITILSFVQGCVVRPAIEQSETSTTLPGLVGGHMHPSQVTPAQASGQRRDEYKFKSGLRESQQICDMFVKQLLQRCSKKGEDGGASEFRPVLSNLIDDLLTVLLIPEYPAAEMILLSIANIISQDLMRAAATKSSQQLTETTYLNTAFDAIGKICAAEARILKYHREKPVRLKSTTHTPEERFIDCYCKKKDFSESLMLNCDRCNCWYYADCVGLNRETVPDQWYCDACQLGRIVEFERDRNSNLGDLACSSDLIDAPYCMRRLLIDYLSILSRKTGLVGIQDAYGFHVAKIVADLTTKKVSQSKGTAGGTNLESNLSIILRTLELWDPKESSSLRTGLSSQSLSGMMKCLSDEGRSRMVVHLATSHSNLLKSFRSQIGLIVKIMNSENSAQLRKLAVKAIEKVTDADQQLMLYPFVNKAVSLRFSDEAISVREAAVSLVGSYVVQSPSVANAFHAAFMVGLNDTGVSVRKRTIKILQDVLCTNPTYKGRAAACSEMLRLAADPKEDDGVRDLIYDLFMKVWLENGEEQIVNAISASPVTPAATENKLTSPGAYVLGVEESGAVGGVITPTPQSYTPYTPTPSKSTRSTAKKLRKNRLQHRSEIAAEQMIEVVKAADTGNTLTALFRELLTGVADTDKHRKSSERLRRQKVARSHCAMIVDSLFEILLSVEENRSKYTSNLGREFVAVMRTIRVFAEVAPGEMVKHLDTFLPYIQADNGLRVQDEAVIVGSLCAALARTTVVFDREDIERLSSMTLADDLVNITYKFGRDALSSAVRALCALAHHNCTDENSPFRVRLLKVAQTFYEYLYKHREIPDFSTKGRKIRANVHRALSVLGSVCRYHETEEDLYIEEDDSDDDSDDGNDEEDGDGDENMERVKKPKGPKQLDWINLTGVCEVTFTKFLRKNDPQTKCAALSALSGVFIAHPRELLRLDQSGVITEVMSPETHPSVQIEALRCWCDILLTEEARIESGEAKSKMDSKDKITLSKKISGDQDADATLFGGVLTNHASRLFEMSQVADRILRFASLDLIGHLLRQGQVNPNETVPFLLALQGDVEEDHIRTLALKLLMTEGEKRPDMLRQRVCAGVKQAYIFQKTVYPHLQDVSALVPVRKHGTVQTECVFSAVFKDCVGKIKKQRQGLFRNLLSLFDIQQQSSQIGSDGKKDKTKDSDVAKCIDLPLLSYASQVLAFLPYTFASDPLYIIHYITSTIALQGSELLEQFASFLRPYGLSSSDEMDESNAGEDALEIAAKNLLPRHANEAAPLLKSAFDKITFSNLCSEAGALILLLRLKAFLRKAYDLSESRCLSFNPDTKERKNADRVIPRVSMMSFNSKLSMVILPSEEAIDLDGMILHYSEFRQLMRAETSTDIKLDDFSDDERPTNKKRRIREDESDDDDDSMGEDEL